MGLIQKDDPFTQQDFTEVLESKMYPNTLLTISFSIEIIQTITLFGGQCFLIVLCFNFMILMIKVCFMTESNHKY